LIPFTTDPVTGMSDLRRGSTEVFAAPAPEGASLPLVGACRVAGPTFTVWFLTYAGLAWDASAFSREWRLGSFGSSPILFSRSTTSGGTVAVLRGTVERPLDEVIGGSADDGVGRRPAQAAREAAHAATRVAVRFIDSLLVTRILVPVSASSWIPGPPRVLHDGSLGWSSGRSVVVDRLTVVDLVRDGRKPLCVA
jgi:hypothetical protein